MLGNPVWRLRRWGVSWRTIIKCALGFHGPKRRLWMGYCPRCGQRVEPIPHVTCYACGGVQEHHDHYPKCDYCGEPEGLLSAVEMLRSGADTREGGRET